MQITVKFSILILSFFIVPSLLGCKELPVSECDPTTSKECSPTDNNNNPNPSTTIKGWQLVYGSATSEQVAHSIVHDSKLYLAKHDYGNGLDTRVRISVYNGKDDSPVWTPVDGGINGLNINTAMYAVTPFLVSFDNKLYVFWTEATSSSPVVHGKVYNGNDSAPAWTSVDGNPNGVLQNGATTKHIYGATAFVFNNQLYLTFHVANVIRVAVFNSNNSSPSWSYVDGGGLNYNQAQTTTNSYPRLVSAGGKLFAFWSENSAVNCCIDQIRAKVFNGPNSNPSWTFIDGGTAQGLNRVSSIRAHRPEPIGFGPKIYLMWREYNSSVFNGSVTQIRVSVYDTSATSPMWLPLDAGGTEGLNFDSSKQVTPGTFAISNSGNLIATWTEDASVRVAQYNGIDTQPAWNFIDGNSPGGLITNPAHSVSLSLAVIFNSKLYGMWTESANGRETAIKIARAPQP